MREFLRRHKQLLVYSITVVLSITILIVGGIWAQYTPPFTGQVSLDVTAVVTQVVDVKEESYELSGEQGSFETRTIAFRARITSGELKGLEVTGYQQQDSLLAGAPKDVEAGDKVLITFTDMGEGTDEWLFMDYHRSDALLWLAGVFLLLLVLFGRRQGVNTIVSLVFTVLAVFVVFVPSILRGKNIYVMAAAVCLFCTLSTLLIVSGWSKKTLCASAGCVGGLVTTGLVTLFMSHVMHLTGMVDSNAMYLSASFEDITIDLKAVIFGAILVGALGAVMDVAMSLSSALREVAEQMGEKRSYRVLVRSGMTIGRDIMGTMANTLILAYIGSSLSVVLLLVASADSMLSLFNREMIVVEVMQALAGSLGILSTIPITSLLASWVYTRPGSHKK